ncbi:MAG TPA: DUF4350 domain-containing protein [Chryseosolibacter sp.]|nr:DUF4350 domain-containing protein [Chryseosolibacter sp.]
MKKRNVSVIVLLCLLGGLILIYFITSDDGKHYQWYESYRASSEQPYGTMFIEKMLESYRADDALKMNDKVPLRKLLKDMPAPGTDYVLVGHSIFLDELSLKALVDFIDAGGNAFIATVTPPTQLLNAIYYKECGAYIEYESNLTPDVRLNFFHESLKRENGYQYAFRFGDTDEPYPWSFIKDGVFCDSTKSLVPLGYQEYNRVNFVKIPAGEGNLFLHSNPLVFTNYFLTRQDKVDYAAAVFSHLDGERMIWDEYSKIASSRGNAYDSPLYYILRQPALKYAWWMLLITVALYVVFAARRRQRVIPVLETKTNTSLEFINLISRLHYKNGNHVDMARKKMKYFLYFVRSKYGIHAETFSEGQMRMLAEKARVNIADVRAIFSQYYLIEEKFSSYIEPNRLVDLYESIENFYRQSK